MQSYSQKSGERKEGRMLQHPGVIWPRFSRMVRATVTLTLIQLLWAFGLFYIGSKHPNLILIPGGEPIQTDQNKITSPEMHQRRPVLYRPLVIYALYSMLHGFYVLIACGMARYLRSKGWLRTLLNCSGSVVCVRCFVWCSVLDMFGPERAQCSARL